MLLDGRHALFHELVGCLLGLALQIGLAAIQVFGLDFLLNKRLSLLLWILERRQLALGFHLRLDILARRRVQVVSVQSFVVLDRNGVILLHCGCA